MASYRCRCALASAFLLAGLLAWPQTASATSSGAGSFGAELRSTIGDVSDLIGMAVRRDHSRSEVRQIEHALDELMRVLEHHRPRHGSFGRGMHHSNHHASNGQPGQHGRGGFKAGVRSAMGDIADLIGMEARQHGSRSEVRHLESALNDLMRVLDQPGKHHGKFAHGASHSHWNIHIHGAHQKHGSNHDAKSGSHVSKVGQGARTLAPGGKSEPQTMMKQAAKGAGHAGGSKSGPGAGMACCCAKSHAGGPKSAQVKSNAADATRRPQAKQGRGSQQQGVHKPMDSKSPRPQLAGNGPGGSVGKKSPTVAGKHAGSNKTGPGKASMCGVAKQNTGPPTGAKNANVKHGNGASSKLGQAKQGQGSQQHCMNKPSGNRTPQTIAKNSPGSSVGKKIGGAPNNAKSAPSNQVAGRPNGATKQGLGNLVGAKSAGRSHAKNAGPVLGAKTGNQALAKNAPAANKSGIAKQGLGNLVGNKSAVQNRPMTPAVAKNGAVTQHRPANVKTGQTGAPKLGQAKANQIGNNLGAKHAPAVAKNMPRQVQPTSMPNRGRVGNAANFNRNQVNLGGAPGRKK